MPDTGILKKTRFTLRFPPEVTEKPVTYHLVKDFNFKVNILRAKIVPGEEGKLLMEVEADEQDLERGLAYIRSEGVEVQALAKQVSWDQERCIHCGACTAVCGPGALFLDRETWLVGFDASRCVACEMCVPACPVRVIQVAF